MGAAGTMVVGNSLQVVFGTRSENLKSDMDEYLHSAGGLAAPAPAQAPAAAKARAALPDVKRQDVLALRQALGGRDNIRSVRCVAGTRLAVELADAAKLDREAARAHGVRFVLPLGQGRLQLLIGPEAEIYAEALLLPELERA
jgi:PTS system glucose-specific IIC component